MKVKITLIVCGVILGICALAALGILLMMMGRSEVPTYPGVIASDWVCEDPYFEIHYKEDGPNESYLVWEGEKLPVFVGLHLDYFDVFLRRNPEDPLDENVLFRGTWKYVEDKIVVHIKTDNIFNGAYTELVFVPQ